MISIVTPSFQSSEWLKLCVASVADQAGVEVEHIVQDACSSDGTGEWLRSDSRVQAFFEKDDGMYDAINRGFGRALGGILAYLNCDEQYLPGALLKVEKFFAANPDIDVLIADTVVTDAKGDYICHRYALRPLESHIWYRFPALTASLFIRRRVFAEQCIRFDTHWRAAGDLFWVLEFLRRGIKIGVLREFTSTFADTGNNLALSPVAKKEALEMGALTPAWVKMAKPLLLLHHRLRMILCGTFSQKPFDYSIYTSESPNRRVTRHVPVPSGIWHGRT